MEYFKILDYSETTATVYYVSENMSGGNVLEFVKQNEEWVYSNWETIWSKTGSASDIIWPYWWHFIYGGI